MEKCVSGLMTYHRRARGMRIEISNAKRVKGLSVILLSWIFFRESNFIGRGVYRLRLLLGG